MSDEKKSGTKEYVVVFDQVDVHTGEMRSQGVGMPQVAVAESYFRSDKVKLTSEQAERLVKDGAVIEASDKRAKLVKPNPARTTGITRDVDQALANVIPLEETATPVAGGEGAKRGVGGKLGTAAELGKLKVTELKELAKTHGVEVERGATKASLAKKLAGLQATGAAEDDEIHPGQLPDQSPPPEDQPKTGPDDADEE